MSRVDTYILYFILNNERLEDMTKIHDYLLKENLKKKIQVKYNRIDKRKVQSNNINI